jgi:hypothetical protein
MILASSGLALLRNLAIIVVVGLAIGFARPFLGPLIARMQKRVKSDKESRASRGTPAQGGKPKPTPVTRRHGRRRR